MFFFRSQYNNVYTRKKKNLQRGNHVYRCIHFGHYRDTDRPTCCRMTRILWKR